MNRKQIENIVDKLVTFKVITNNYQSGFINTDKMNFPHEGIIQITDDINNKEVFLQIKDIKSIIGVK